MNKRIGITEKGDSGLDFSWVDKINNTEFTVLITKSINDKFIENVLKFKNKVIIHATITGHGETILEPNVKNYKWSFSQLQKLIDKGFNKDQIVLRLDPIIPTPKGLLTAKKVLDYNKETVNIKRVRVSLIDMYNHVKQRFIDNELPLPYGMYFSPSSNMVNATQKLLSLYDNEFESCNEKLVVNGNSISLGCVSKKDLDVLGIDFELKGSSYQRKGCLCPSNKTELLSNKKQCPHGCLYCYWRN